MKIIIRIATKDLRLLWRDKGGMFFILVFPLIYAVFFSLIFGGQQGGRTALRIAITDLANTPASRELVVSLSKSSAIAIEELGHDEARDLVRLGKKVAHLEIQPGYGEGSNPFGPPQGKVSIGIDPARQAESAWLIGLLHGARFQKMRETFGKSMGFDKPWIEKVEIARDSTGEPTSVQAVTFPSAIVWGLLGCAAGFALSLVRERNEGTLLRLQVAPISTTQVMGGKALACFMACVSVMTLLIGFAVLVLGMDIGSPLFLLLAVLCNAIAFTGLMMLISVLGNTEAAVSGGAWAGFVVMAMIGGGMVPLIMMPEWLFQLSSISPVKWSIIALEGAIWRAFDLREMLLPCGILVGIGSASFALSVPRLRRAG